MEKQINHKSSWDVFWDKNIKNENRKKFLHFMRTKIIASSVQYFANKYFPKKGFFLEAGSGSSQTSNRLDRYDRHFCCLDFSHLPLTEALKVPPISTAIQGDIFNIPLKSNSVDGIWNLGVMEHFNDDEIDSILKEFHRILKPGSHALLFWPPLIGWYKFAALMIELILTVLTFKKVQLYPDEINLYLRKSKIQKYCKDNGFKLVECSTTHRDLFTYKNVIIQKE